jgi:hypothetical protein
LLRLDDGLLSAVQRVQEPLSRFDWITLQPNYFLHTGIGGVASQPRRPSRDEIKAIVERARRVWAGVKSFDITYPRLNCFHEAVVAEVEGDGPRGLVSKLVEANYWSDLPVAGAMRGVQLDTFLPHLTLATVNRPSDPRPLQNALVALHGTGLGDQRVSEATLCVIPASRSTILDPWEVVGSVTFD